MPPSADPPPVRVSQSFARDEVLAVCRILELLRRGGDSRSLASRPEAVEALRKFQRMRARLAVPDAPCVPPEPEQAPDVTVVAGRPWRPGYLAD